MINLLIPFAAALLATARGVAQRLVAGSALLLGTAGVIVTFSRAGFLTLAALGVVGMLAMARRRPLACIAVIWCSRADPRSLPQGYFERLSTITNIESDTTGSAQGRWNDAVVAMGVVARNPVTGVGLNQNILALNQQRGPTWREVHNVYLQYAVDLGLPGLALFLALFIALFRTAGRVRRRARCTSSIAHSATVAGGVQAALIGILSGGVLPSGRLPVLFFLRGRPGPGGPERAPRQERTVRCLRPCDAADTGSRNRFACSRSCRRCCAAAPRISS